MRNPLTIGPGHYSILLLHIRHSSNEEEDDFFSDENDDDFWDD